MSINQKIKFDYKTEAVFMTLSGYANSCYEMLSDEDSSLKRLILATNQYFRKSRFRYNKVQTKLIVNYMQDKIDDELNGLGKSSPQILLVLTLDYLVNEQRHTMSRMKFSHFDYAKLIDSIYSKKEYQEHIKSHCDFLERIK